MVGEVNEHVIFGAAAGKTKLVRNPVLEPFLPVTRTLTSSGLSQNPPSRLWSRPSGPPGSSLESHPAERKNLLQTGVYQMDLIRRRRGISHISGVIFGNAGIHIGAVGAVDDYSGGGVSGKEIKTEHRF